MQSGNGRGILAIWNNIRDGQEGEFERWYQTEHFFERIGVPGFMRGRRYEAVEGAPKYFCYYLTEAPDTLLSPAYLARLNDPTPLTRKIMSEAFCDMSRTVCQLAGSLGRMQGVYAVTARLYAVEPRLAALAERLAADLGVARCELWAAADQGGAIAEEERLRGGDRKITQCLLVDTLRLATAKEIRDRLQAELGTDAEIGIYRLLCEIEPNQDR